jgi:hypothetical protein
MEPAVGLLVHPRPGLGTLVKSTNTLKKSSNYPNTTKNL